LLVKPVLPYPPDQGTKVVSFALIESLSTAHEVTVLARVLDRREEASARELERHCARVVTVLPRNRRDRWSRVAFKLGYALRSLVTRRSMKSLYDCPGAFVRTARALASERFDLVVVEYWQLYPMFDVFEPARTVLLTHDVDLAVNRERLLRGARTLAWVAAARRWRAEAREEIQAYRRAACVWTLSRRDADAVRELSDSEVDVLPFGLSASSFTPSPQARDSREVLFLGAMGAAFNRDALAYFAAEILPLLSSLEHVRFTVVGGPRVSEFDAVAGERNVELVGHQRDVRPFLERAACLLVPLRFGGGIRIRILEAMAAGLPVVCSPIAVEGMGLEAGREVLVAREPREYRAHVERLLEDRAFALELARAARDRVWEAYGPDARGPRTRALVEAAMGKVGKRGA
jgi:glycosyltransferase involved in cell wall biosynthesis